MVQAMLSDAARGLGMDRDEAHVVELVRRLEEHTGSMLSLALRRRGRPGGVARRELELRGMRRLVREPGAHLAREAELREFAIQQRPRGRVGVELRELAGLHLMQGTALDELALH